MCGTLAQAPFAPGSCAAVTMFHVLEHLYDPASYLRAAHELLAPDGRLIVQVPNAACWQFLLLGERWNGIDVPRHLTDFRASDLDRLLESCGFEVLRHKHFSLRDNPAGLATSLAPKLDPMARRIRQGCGDVRGSGCGRTCCIPRWWQRRCRSRCSKPYAAPDRPIMVEARKKS